MAPREPIAKLPLAIRKEIRDTWEAQHLDLVKEIDSLLSESYKVDINPNELYAYADERASKENPGRTFSGYIAGFVKGLKTYVEQSGSDGVKHFNEAVFTHTITIAPDESGKVAYIGSEIKDGQFIILFNEKYFGSNLSKAGDNIAASVDAVPRTGGSAEDSFPLVVKQSIATKYSSEISAVKADLEKILNLSDLVLDPNFVENYSALKALGDDAIRGWQENFGRHVLTYFTGLKTQLEGQGFAKDDMLQEGFVEAVDKKTIKVRMVDKLERKTYNECVIKEGVLYLQTTPKHWSANMKDAGAGLVDLL